MDTFRGTEILPIFQGGTQILPNCHYKKKKNGLNNSIEHRALQQKVGGYPEGGGHSDFANENQKAFTPPPVLFSEQSLNTDKYKQCLNFNDIFSASKYADAEQWCELGMRLLKQLTNLKSSYEKQASISIT